MADKKHNNQLIPWVNDIGDNAFVPLVQTYGAVPAGTSAIGAVALQTDAINNGNIALTPKFAAISSATSDNNTLVAAVVGSRIRVLSLFFTMLKVKMIIQKQIHI